VGPTVPGDMAPVVHARPLELLVVQLKSERFDQVKLGAGDGAEPGDIAGVGRDFRFEEDHMHAIKPDPRVRRVPGS